jgi:hypothetical protein
MTIMLAGSKPTSIARACRRLRTNRPAPTSSNIEHATCATTKALRRRERRPRLLDVSSLSTGTRSARDA